MTPQEKIILRTKILDSVKNTKLTKKQKEFFINFCVDHPNKAMMLIEWVRQETKQKDKKKRKVK